MKKHTAIISTAILTSLVVLVFYVTSMKLFTRKIRNAFPELEGQSTVLFIPWPFGPKWISNVSSRHPLYVQAGESGGTIHRDGYQITVMASDGTVIGTGNRRIAAKWALGILPDKQVIRETEAKTEE